MFSKVINIFKAFDLFKIKEDSNGIRYVNESVRFLTVIVDLMCLAFMVYIISYTFGMIFHGFLIAPADIKVRAITGEDLSIEDKEFMLRYFIIWIIQQFVQFGALLLIVVSMWTKFGATPGKLLFGIKVVDTTTLKYITVKQGIKRFLSFPLSILPLCAGIIWSIFDKKGQTFHDKIANTVVVFKNSLRKLNVNYNNKNNN